MIYAQTSIYRISYIISGVFVLVTLHQLIAGFFSSDDESTIPQLVPIQDSVMTSQESDNTHAELDQIELEYTHDTKDTLDNSDAGQ